MGYNIAGFIINQQVDSNKLQQFIGKTTQPTITVSGEEATQTKFENTIDVLSTEKGSIVFVDMEYLMMNLIDFEEFKVDALQFIISDVSGTYFMEQYKNGTLTDKLITTEGNIVEQKGDFFTEEEDFTEIVWEYAEKTLGKFDLFEAEFQRYE